MSNKRITNGNKKELGIFEEISSKSKKTKQEKTKTTKDPFNMIIVGPTFCGKTTYLLNLIEEEYLGYFDFIFLICTTYMWNDTYDNWKYNDEKNFVVISCKQSEVESFLSQVVDFAKGTNSLIILDDCASGKFVKERTSELIELAFSARHYGISIIIITQQLTSIAKPFRENISRLISFYNRNKNDMNTIFDENLGDLSKKEKDNINIKLKNKKFSKLDIYRRFPYNYSVY